MKYFHATLEEFQIEIAIWIRNYFPELRVINSNENKLILAIGTSTDVRLVAEKIRSDLVRLELRSYEELHPMHRPPSRQTQEVYKNLIRKIDVSWLEPSQLPHGESDRTSERTRLPIELQTNTRILQNLDSLSDEDKVPDYEMMRQQLEEEHQKLKQRLDRLRRELDEIFSEETLPPATPVLRDAVERPQRTYDQRGMNFNTEAKVREAHRLLKAGTIWSVVKDTCSYETYMKWCKQVTGEDPIIKH